MAEIATRYAVRKPGISALAWGIGPAVLLYVIFFLIPLATMLMLSFLTGNPATNPNVRLTTRHYDRILAD